MKLALPRRWRVPLTVLQVVPVPGVGAMVAGWRNPHTPLRRNGMLQALLVVLGSWPLVLPGLAGLAWAAWDARHVWRARPPGAKSRPLPGWTDEVGPPPSEDAPDAPRRRPQKGKRR